MGEERRLKIDELIVHHLRKYVDDLTAEEEKKHRELVLRLVAIYSKPELEPLRRGVKDEILGFVGSSHREYGRYTR